MGVQNPAHTIAIITTYNEEENIISTIENIKNYAPNIDYIIINGSSNDKTELICKEHGHSHISLPVNLDLAGTYQTGMNFAYQQGYNFTLQFSADGQHSAAYVDKIINTAINTNANVVIGSRFSTRKNLSLHGWLDLYL